VARSILPLALLLLLLAVPLMGPAAASQETPWAATYEVRLESGLLLVKPVSVVPSSGKVYIVGKASLSPLGPMKALVFDALSGDPVFLLDAGDTGIVPLAFDPDNMVLAATLYNEGYGQTIVIARPGGVEGYTIPGQGSENPALNLEAGAIVQGTPVLAGTYGGGEIVLWASTSGVAGLAYHPPSANVDAEWIVDLGAAGGTVFAASHVAFVVGEYSGTGITVLDRDAGVLYYARLAGYENTRLDVEALLVLPDNRIVVGGTTSTAGELYDAWVAVLSWNGTHLVLEGSVIFGSEDNDYVVDLVPCSDGFAAIGVAETGWDEKIFIVKFNNNLEAEDVMIFNRIMTSNTIRAATQDGTIYIAGAWVTTAFVDSSFKAISPPILVALEPGDTGLLEWQECPPWGCSDNVNIKSYGNLEEAGLPAKASPISIVLEKTGDEIYQYQVSLEPVDPAVEDLASSVSVRAYLALPSSQETTTTTTTTETETETETTGTTTTTTTTTIIVTGTTTTITTTTTSSPTTTTTTTRTTTTVTAPATTTSLGGEAEAGTGGLTMAAALVALLIIAGAALMIARR